LVHCRTAQLLSIKNLASRNSGVGLRPEKVRELDEEALRQVCGGDENRMAAMRSSLTVFHCLDEQIQDIERRVLAQAKLKPDFEKVMTIAGIGKILGMTIMYEAGTMERFGKVGQFASYGRCVGSSRWSNGKKKGEGNRKNGNKYLAWAFVEAAHYAVRYNQRIRKFFDRKKAKTNGIVAVKAVAHKLARACYHVLKEQAPFEETRAFA
jgi:transposase